MKREENILPSNNCSEKYICIPLEMASYPQWGFWNAKKEPCSIYGGTVDNGTFNRTLQEAAEGFDPQVHKGLGFSLRVTDPFVGIDYDHVLDENGDITNPVILAEVEELNTLTELSQSGTGLHCICKVDAWPEGLDQGTTKPAGEIYYSGHYFAITGNIWQGKSDIRTVEPELIRSIYNRLKPPAETATSTTQRPKKRISSNPPAKVHEGGRHTFLVSEAGRMRHFGTIPKAIHLQLEALNQEHCTPPLDDAEVRSIAYSIGKYPAEYNPTDAIMGAEIAESLLQGADNPDEEPINAADLVSGYQANKLKLDLSILPSESLVSRYVEHMGKRSDSYPEYQYTGAMFVISTLIRRNGFIRFRHGTIYPNLWCMNLGASTVSRKSTAVNSISSLMTDVMAGDTSLIDIRGPRKCENSFTPEAFIESLAEHPVQYLILDECGMLLADMQKTYMANIRDLFCTIFDNMRYERRLRTKKRPEEKSHFVIEDPYFTTLAATTPDTLAKHSAILDLTSGWLLRYVYTLPAYTKEFKAFEPDDEGLNSEYDSLVEAFRKIRMIFEQNTVEFRLSPDALATYQNWQRRMETTLAEEGDEIKLSAFGRLADAAVKMAIIHTIANPVFVDADHTQPCMVQSRELDMSIRHIEGYFLPVFCDVADLVSHRESKNLQDKIIGFLKRKGGKCTRTMLLKYLHRKASDINPELNTLVESEEVQETEAKSEKGRLERWYILN